ncbi:hypothetical protein [Anaerocolumna sp. MB42-C2]|uniref:hypothetical protein n=1 Tax=Anaerocolumna sp. MB42-C2 TaxID=3070997 RepID=UPI0027DFB884|nr:hypothetical protein [Anaerocolumna sp. MB42-C2]WMJ87399.1 hypothetical protein RBU59_25735 [Anaerocolumna sp. MB42-C2]
MEFKYYVQEYAKKRADSILPVPKNYPLRGDFKPNFYSDFSELTELLKRIYIDVAENPAAYGCDLYPLDNEMRGKGVDNESNLSLDRTVKYLRTLCDCAEIENHTLKVKTELFKKQVKKIKRHFAIAEKLKAFNFCFQESEDNTYLLISYPNKPTIIDVLKIYMDCWNEVLNDEYIKSEIKKNGYGCIAYYYNFYLFDYKTTANPKKLEPMQIIKDDTYTWDERCQQTYISFYEYSKKYPTIRSYGRDYYIGKKRIGTLRYDANHEFLNLKLKLKNPDKYISEIEKLPENLQSCFSNDVKKCWGCGCLGNNPDMCSNRIYWKFSSVEYIGCSMESFYFNGIKSEDIPRLFSLLEYEYSIKKSN